jgi:preprotein translocase subunit SecD
LTHEAHVIPSTGKDTISMGLAAGVVMLGSVILLGSMVAGVVKSG